MSSSPMKNIMEHLPESSTDKLYQPLRRALSRGSLSSRKEYQRSDSPLSREIKHSKLTRKTYELNSREAHQMEKNIFVPAFRRLRQTHKMDKVQNKRFTAIDASIQQKATITEQQLRKRLANVSLRTQQIVYIPSETPPSSEMLYHSSNFPTIQRSISREFGSLVGGKFLPTTITKAPISQSPEKYERMVSFSESSEKNSNRMSHPDLKKAREPSQTYCSTKIKKIQQKKRKQRQLKANLYSCLDVSVSSHCNTCTTQNQLIATKPKRQRWGK